MKPPEGLPQLQDSAEIPGGPPIGLTPDVLFIEDVSRILRTSRSTIERRRRSGTFPIPELISIDGRPRWSRQAIERYLTSSNNGHRAQRGRRRGQR